MWENAVGVQKAQIFGADYHFKSLKWVHFRKEKILTVKEQRTPFGNCVLFGLNSAAIKAETNFQME